MVTPGLKGAREVGKKTEVQRVRGTVARSEKNQLIPATDTAVFAHGFISVCLYIRFWEEFLWSVICLCPAQGGGDTSFPSDWNQIDQPYQFPLQEEVLGLRGDNTRSQVPVNYNETAHRRFWFLRKPLDVGLVMLLTL